MTANLLDLDGKRSMDKQKALDSALAQIERQFGKGSIMKLGQDGAVQEIEATSTGSLGLDIALAKQRFRPGDSIGCRTSEGA